MSETTIDKTHVVVILDRSGSMGPIAAATVEKFNEYKGSLTDRDDAGAITLSVAKFDDRYDLPYENEKVEDVPDFVEYKASFNLGLTESEEARNEFRPRGMTALLDAIGKTMGEGRELPDNERGLCVIITDGLENASNSWDNKKVGELIRKLEDEHGWTFVYLGANQDSFATASQFGFRDAHNTLNWEASNQGIALAAGATMSATTRYLDNSQARGGSYSCFRNEDDDDKWKKPGKDS